MDSSALRQLLHERKCSEAPVRTPRYQWFVLCEVEFDDLVNLVNTDNTTCVHYIAKNPHFSKQIPEIMELLIKKNIDFNCRNNNGETALHNSAWKGTLNVAACLVKYTNLNLTNYSHGEVPSFALLPNVALDCSSLGRSYGPLRYCATSHQRWC